MQALHVFFNVVPSSEETSFLTTFSGIYFIHQLHITNHAGPSVWAAIQVASINANRVYPMYNMLISIDFHLSHKSVFSLTIYE